MKKSIFTLMSIVALFAASCTTDATSDVQMVGSEEAVVTFSVQATGLGSRAVDINDGKKATELTYAIYDKDWNHLQTYEAEFENGSLVKELSLRLVKNKTYNFVFWAQNPNVTCYTMDFETAGQKPSVSVNYDALVANNDNYDAFFGQELALTVNGTVNKTVYLKRPFAQINFGTDDLQAAKELGFDLAQAKVAVTTMTYSKFFLNDGAVDGATREVTFTDADAIDKTAADKNLSTKSHGNYHWVSMNYILWPNPDVAADASKDLSLSKCEMTVAVTGQTSIKVEVPQAPARRNWRTNLVGSLLTEQGNIKVEIKPVPEDEYNVGYVVNGNVATISNAEGFGRVAEQINAGDLSSDMDIVLDGDIDLSDLAASARTTVVSNWTPIGTSAKPFTGSLDGNGYTIKNLTLVEAEAKEGKAYIGFFGYAKNATIKNVTFENVYLNIPCLDIDHSQGHIGAVAGSLEGTSTIENVTVKGDINVYATQDANGASRVAVVAGGNSYGNVTMKNVHIIANEGSSLIANNNTGALAGQLQGKSVFENCSSNIDVTVNKFFAGGIIGLAAGDQLFTNCHTTGNISVLAGRSGKAHDHYRVGGIAGGWADGAKNVCTLVNCSYTGKLTGVNSDGSVADKFDYLGYVGRGYTLNGCAGSKVVIDGIEFVQVGNTAAEAGVYTVTNAEGEEVVAAGSKEDLPKTDDGTKIDTNFDEDTTLFGDITLSAGETNANSGYAATGVKVSNGAVLDGKGNTLTVNDANSTWACCVAVTGGTIKNLTVAGAMRGIFMPGADGDVYIDNVTFKDVVYTFNSDAGNKNYGVYISNCTINGWTSHSDVHKEVVYTNCKFGEGSGYAFCRPYGKTDFVGCDFEAGYKIDARGAVSFDNCTFGGVALTAENLATLVTSNIANATVK